MVKFWSEQKSREFDTITEEDIVILQVSSCEQHAKHLPVGTDAYIGAAVAKMAAEKSKRTVYLLPPIAYGFSQHHMDFKGSITLRQSTLIALVEDVLEGAVGSGFRNLLVLNSHGGNQPSLHVAINELGSRHEECTIGLIKYWDFIHTFIQALRTSPVGGMGHGGELETSLMLYLEEWLVDKENNKGYEAAKGGKWHNPDMFATNKVTFYQRFSRISPDGNVGMGQLGSREKGEKIASYLAEELGGFLDTFFEKSK